MGRIDLAQDNTTSTSPSPRAYHTVRGTTSPSGSSLSPPTSRPVSSSGSNTISKSSKGHVRAKVDMSSFSGMTNTPSISTSTNPSSSSNPSTPKNPTINGRLSPSISVSLHNGNQNTSSNSNNRASPSTFAPQNVTSRSNGIRTKVRNNSEDLSNLSSSSGSSGFTHNGINSNNVISPKSGGVGSSTTISSGLRGHSRSITSSHVSSIFPSPSSTSTTNSNQPGRIGAKVSIKPTSINRSRTPSPTRNERPNMNRFGSNISGMSNSASRNMNPSFPPSSPKKEFNSNIFQPTTRDGMNLAPAYETPITSPEQPQQNTIKVNTNLNRSNSVSNSTPSSQITSPVSTPLGTQTKSGFYAHAYGRPNTSQPSTTTTATTHSRSNSTVSSNKSNNTPNPNFNDLSNPSSRGIGDGLISPTFKSNLISASSNQNQFPFERQASSSSSSSLLSPTFDPNSGGPLLSPKEEAEAKEAKKNRKILDLEITNKSLLAINAGLEVTKLKQAREIRELKRKVRMSLAGGGNVNLDELLGKKKKKKKKKEDDDGDGDGEYFQDADEFDDEEDEDEDFEDDEEDENEEEDEEGEAELNPELEQSHTKCKNLIDQMILLARKSILEKFHFDEEIKDSGGTKVLHPLELEQLEEEKRKKREKNENGNESEIKEGEGSVGESTIHNDQGDGTQIKESTSIDSITSTSNVEDSNEVETSNQDQEIEETSQGFPTSSSNVRLNDHSSSASDDREVNLKRMKDEEYESDSDDGSDGTSIAINPIRNQDEDKLHPDASID